VENSAAISRHFELLLREKPRVVITTQAMKSVKAIAIAVVASTFSLLSAVPAAAELVPSYATGSTDETIRGTVASVSGQYNIAVRDERGFVDNISLHRGTIINPKGLMIAPGESVTIVGSAQGSTFVANEIDTPYQEFDIAQIYPAYGYYGYPYGGYGYGPSYRIGIGFGHGGFGFRAR
jgi:hypothetical protein